MALTEEEKKELEDSELDKKEQEIVMNMAKIMDTLFFIRMEMKSNPPLSDKEIDECDILDEGLNLQKKKLYYIQERKGHPNDNLSKILFKYIKKHKSG